jgi:hypothetical protein
LLIFVGVGVVVVVVLTLVGIKYHALFQPIVERMNALTTSFEPSDRMQQCYQFSILRTPIENIGVVVEQRVYTLFDSLTTRHLP